MKRLDITDKGLHIDGSLVIPAADLAEDITIRHAGPLHMVGVFILADSLSVSATHATITQEWD